VAERTWDEILNIMTTRRSDDAPLLAQMIDTRDRYNADVVIPLTDVSGEPFTAPLGPQTIHDGIDHTAMRAAGTMPTIAVPAIDPSKPTGVRSVEYAEKRRKALYASHHYNLTQILFARVFRQLAGYGLATIVAMPDFKDERARIEMRSALNTYPDPRALDDYRPPENVGFVYGRSTAWIRSNFGLSPEDLMHMNHTDASGLWDVCEWMDEYCIVLGILGPRLHHGVNFETQRAFGGKEVRRWPNRAGMVTAAVGKRITLDRVAGQMEIITGSADWLDRLMALNVIAAEKSIFADMYALAVEGRTPEIVDGQWKDGRSGEINVLANVKAVGQLISGASPHSQQVIGMLTQSAQASGGAIPQFGGDLDGARTGRALDTIAGISVSPRVAELQHVMEAMLSRTIHPSIFEIEKGYWPDKKYVCFSGSITDRSYVEYTPSIHFEATENAVAYAFPGMDVASVSVALLQLVGADLIPKHQARVLHPLIDDAEGSGQQIVLERLAESVLIGLQQQATQGALPINDLATIYEKVSKGMMIHEAILEAQKEAQDRQATVPEEVPEGMGAPPQTMPGLAMPGMGAESMAPEFAPQLQGPTPSQEGLRHMLRTISAE